MKIAYLIRAYTDPRQLLRLIQALSGNHAYFFIHVQPNLSVFRRVDITPFIELTSGQGNVRFTSRRLHVNWGGFSMVEATLALIRDALNSGIQFDYLVLLSGLDYPIKSNARIVEFFARYRGREFIRYFNIRDTPFLAWKVEVKWFNEYVFINNALRRLRRSRIGGMMNAFPLKRSRIPQLDFFCGPSWWAITGNCADYIIRFVDRNKEFVDFYRFVDQPDESFFQTIIMNSEFGRRTNQRVEYEDWGFGHVVKHAGDLIMFVKGFSKGRSLVLDERDFGLLEKSSCLFARKLTTARSTKLIELIDVHLLGRAVSGS